MFKKILLIILIILTAFLANKYFQKSDTQSLESVANSNLDKKTVEKNAPNIKIKHSKGIDEALTTSVSVESNETVNISGNSTEESLKEEPIIARDLSFDKLFNTYYDDIMEDSSIKCCKSSIESLEVLATTYKVKVLNKLKKGNLSDDSGATRGVFSIKYSENGNFISPETITFYNHQDSDSLQSDNRITLSPMLKEKLKSIHNNGVLRIPPFEGISAFFSGPAGLTLMGHVSASDVIDIDIKDTCSEFIINPIKWVKDKKEYIGVMFCKKINSKKYIKTDMVSVSILP